MELSSWKQCLERERGFKDWFFAVSQRSPIPPGKRKDFKGLDYYPISPDYLFRLKLHEYKEKGRLRVRTTAGDEQEYIRWGEFRFQLEGKEHKLHVYRRKVDEERLFIPFRDATSGKETYGAGRYLDLQPDKHHTREGKWILDLNEAYNPFCAYSGAYTCPLTPPENWLDIPVRAGEKNYTGEE